MTQVVVTVLGLSLGVLLAFAPTIWRSLPASRRKQEARVTEAAVRQTSERKQALRIAQNAREADRIEALLTAKYGDLSREEQFERNAFQRRVNDYSREQRRKARRWKQPRIERETSSSRYSDREIVYVLERITSEGRFFKIGKTSRSDVSRRAYEVRSTIVSYTNEVRERDVHQELHRSRISRTRLPAEITDAHGPTEWFRPTPEVERFAFDGVLPSGRTATMVADRAAA